MTNPTEVPEADGQSPEVVNALDARLPNEPEGRIPTAQLLQIRRGSLAPEVESEVATARDIGKSYAGIAAAAGVLGLSAGLFVVWALPISAAAIAFASVARRNGHSGRASTIGLYSGVAGLVFGLVWIAYYSGLLSP